MTRVLLVEDDAAVARGLVDYLRGKGLDVHHAATLAAARAAVAAEAFAVVVLDWMLPDGEGLELLRAGVGCPVIFLTARTELADRVLGLELGADDYMTKPFEPRELLARVNVQLRKRAPIPALAPQALFDVDPARRRASYRGKELVLTKLEFELLHLFVREPSRVFTREELLNQVWGYDAYPTTRTVDTHVFSLRQKTHADHFETVRGVGYRFVASPAAEGTNN